mgnify:CR=1 FL=1
MSWALILGALAGLATVVQGGLNRRLSETNGLAMATLINGVATLVVAAALYGLILVWPQKFPELLHVRGNLGSDFRAWYVVPGILGFIIVVGLPLSIAYIGATKTFLIMLGFQMLGSLAWDAFLEGQAISTARLVGVALALGGATLAALRG